MDNSRIAGSCTIQGDPRFISPEIPLLYQYLAANKLTPGFPRQLECYGIVFMF
jgi:hypothetical protein